MISKIPKTGTEFVQYYLFVGQANDLFVADLFVKMVEGIRTPKEWGRIFNFAQELASYIFVLFLTIL